MHGGEALLFQNEAEERFPHDLSSILFLNRNNNQFGLLPFAYFKIKLFLL
jgi:hypothetical protein